MRIKHLVKQSFQTTHAHAGIDSIEKRLRDNSFLVVFDRGSFLGILRSSDIIESPHKLVIDCLHDKPRVAFEQDIQSVIGLMKESRNLVLPVFKDDEFIGVVTQAAITDYLLEYHNELKQVISEHTAELAEANKQLEREIEERKLVEEERRGLRVQVEQALKLEAIGTSAGGIAHDFNNLLMGIQGNVSLMLLHIDSSHPDYRRLKNIEEQVESGARLTSHLLGYARKGKYEVNSVSLNQMVRKASEIFGRTRREITIHLSLAEDLFAVEADQGQIEQVLLNMLVNAADAMPGGGDLIIKTINTTHKDMKSKLYEPKPGNYVLLTVTDTGTGMDKKTMERIFDPFFTTKEMARGTGLGLASAYGIIKGHGGYIDVDSKKGQGTTFRIYLPASEKEVQKVVKAAEEVIEGTEAVLLVDDEAVILEVGRDLLEAMGYRVLMAKDGKEAIQVYEKYRDNIDIVVLDMVMPGMGGGEVYDRMKKMNPDIKVLLSSGYSIDGEAAEILERGCDGFIQKPFKMKDLSAKVREVLGKG